MIHSCRGHDVRFLFFIFPDLHENILYFDEISGFERVLLVLFDHIGYGGAAQDSCKFQRFILIPATMCSLTLRAKVTIPLRCLSTHYAIIHPHPPSVWVSICDPERSRPLETVFNNIKRCVIHDPETDN